MIPERRSFLARMDRRLIEFALRECGSVSAAARALKMNRTHLHQRMRDLDVDTPNPARYGRQ